MYTLAELAKRFDADIVGDGHCEIGRIATLIHAGPGDISFLSNKKYRKYLQSTNAAAVVVAPEYKGELRTNGLIVPNPYVVYARIATLLYPAQSQYQGIHPSATIHETASIDTTASIGPQVVIGAGVSIGAETVIGAGCVIEADTQIGKQCLLDANVTLCRQTIIGHRTIIHPGVVIGADGFGLANDGGQWIKIPQIGRVVIGDDVEIGANTCIDRGAIEDTVIEDGVKLDNLIQIGHNVHIGAHTAVAASAAIAGSAKIGKFCSIAGMAGIVGHIEIADNVQITGMSVVSHSIKESGIYSSGTPLEPNAQWHRNSVRFKQLDEMARRIKQLEKRIEDKK